jgi:hypothetical protein
VALEGAERMVLQAILELQGESAYYMDDKQIADKTRIAVGDVRLWLETLEGKDLIQLARTTEGSSAYITAKGRLTLKQSATVATSSDKGASAISSHASPSVRTILFLAANPKNTNRLRLDEEVKKIDEGLRRSKRRDHFRLVQKWAVTDDDLRRGLLDEEPEIVHFAGHAGGAAGLAFEDDTGQAHLISGDALARLFKLCADHVKCVVMNACYSEEQAFAISKHIDFVVGMNKAIGDQAAIKFAVGFYDALGAGKTIDVAYEFGSSAIDLKGKPEEVAPALVRSGIAIRRPAQESTGGVCDTSKTQPGESHLNDLYYHSSIPGQESMASPSQSTPGLPERASDRRSGTNVIFIPTRGKWFARQENVEEASWGLVRDTPGEVCIEPDEVYRLEVEFGDNDERLIGLTQLKGIDSLRSLLWGDCHDVTDAGLVHLRGLTGLRELELAMCFGAADAILAQLRGLTKLRRLNLMCSGVTDAGLYHLRGLTGLRELNVSINDDITDAGLAHLRRLVGLEVLDLSHCDRITSSGLRNLTGLSNLSSLDVSSCNQVGDADLAFMKANLPKCRIKN